MSVRALLFTDVVDSTLLTQRLGDARARQTLDRARPRARASCFVAIAGARSIAPTASSCSSTTPPMRPRYALDYHALLAALGTARRGSGCTSAR